MKLRFNKVNLLSRRILSDVRNTIAIQPQQIIRRLYNDTSTATESVAAPTPLFDLHGRRHNYLRISLTERCNLRLLHASGGCGTVAAVGAADARGAGAAGARVRRRRRRQAAPDGRRAHAARRPRRHRRGAGGRGGHHVGGHDHQRAGADAAAARAAARRPAAPQRVARLAAPRAVRGYGAPPGAGARAGRRGPGAAARLPARQAQRRAHEGVQRRRDRRLRGIHARPRGGGAIHRVHAVRRKPLAGGPPRAAPNRLASRRCRPRPAPRATASQRHRAGVARGGTRGPRGVHLLPDAALLRLLQPAAAHGRRQPQGVPVRRRRGVPARRAPRRRGRRGAGAAGARRAAQQAAATRRHAGARALGQPPHDPHRRVAARALCSRAEDGALSHLDRRGEARMVDVGDKPVTRRAAAAECRLEVGARLLRLLRDARLPKGDALCVARVAGALAAKRTADLLPLCHPLPLECARVRVELPRGDAAAGGAVLLTCEVRVTARTGAEMEALTGCAVAALALYDMCKSVDRDMRITGLRVVRKSGGRSDAAGAAPPPPLTPRALPADPLPESETYAPTNLLHF